MSLGKKPNIPSNFQKIIGYFAIRRALKVMNDTNTPLPITEKKPDGKKAETLSASKSDVSQLTDVSQLAKQPNLKHEFWGFKYFHCCAANKYFNSIFKVLPYGVGMFSLLGNSLPLKKGVEFLFVGDKNTGEGLQSLPKLLKGAVSTTMENYQKQTTIGKLNQKTTLLVLATWGLFKIKSAFQNLSGDELKQITAKSSVKKSIKLDN